MSVNVWGMDLPSRHLGLGVNQRNALNDLSRIKRWSVKKPDPTCYPPAQMRRLLDQMVKRGYVSCKRGVYRPLLSADMIARAW